MPDDKKAELPCTYEKCKELRVSGGLYCEDHTLQQQVGATRTPGLSLAQMIRNAKGKGLISPVSSGYQSS